MKPASTRRLCFFGASPDTGNLGVSALCYAVLGALVRRDPNVAITVFDDGRGVRTDTATMAGQPYRFELCGAAHTRRHYRPESLWRIRVCAWLGGLRNPAAQRIRAADAILDISGGDSFTDMYGPWRFQAVTLTKLIALEQRKPLVLLPQTYGPYRGPRAREIARGIVRRAAVAWARDARSFAALQELLGSDFDAARHRCGVDVAFRLEPRPPHAALPEPIDRWLENVPGGPLVGINVSGLIWNDPQRAVERFGLRADYRRAVVEFVRRLLHETDARLLLVPHVLTPVGHYESDDAANRDVVAALGDAGRGRVACVPALYDQSEMKWIIARLQWFCGTRMHATIAALSSGVPTAAIAYSIKTLGVFECCGQGPHVADPRELSTEEVAEHLWTSFEQRDAARAGLAAALPCVYAQAETQMDVILGATASPGEHVAVGGASG